jgi:putative transposase
LPKYAIKSVVQSFSPPQDLLSQMDTFRVIVNDCIRIGLETGVSSMQRLSCLSYQRLRTEHRQSSLLSCFYLTAISKAAGVLAARKKSVKRGITSKDPYLKYPLLISCYSFKITDDGSLRFSVGTREKKKNIRVPLNKHTIKAISGSGVKVRSFTITSKALSLSIRKEVSEYAPKSFYGIDRNASNVTYGNLRKAIQFDLKKVEEVARSTRQIVRSFKRNDVRIRRKLSAKYGRRRSDRVNQLLHRVSKTIVEDASQNQGTLVFEEIEGLRKLYRKGNFQGKNFRARMNSVPWYEIKRQIEYKAAWNGVPVIQLTRGETRGTSKNCPVCGERLQEDRYSRVHRRELWCKRCGKWRDRDLVAVMNISRKGWLRFRQSIQGEAGEAMVQEPREEGVLLKVDASKLKNSRVLQLNASDED